MYLSMMDDVESPAKILSLPRGASSRQFFDLLFRATVPADIFYCLPPLASFILAISTNGHTCDVRRRRRRRHHDNDVDPSGCSRRPPIHCHASLPLPEMMNVIVGC